jgi:hypothetical protein
MLSFTVRAITFKPKLPQKKRFFVTIELADGATRKTEIATYIPDNTEACFMESFDFPVQDRLKNSYFTLTVLEYVEYNPSRQQLVAKKIINIDESLENENNKLVLPTTNYGEVHIYFSVIPSLEYKNTWQMLSPTGNEERVEDETAATSGGQLEIMKLAPLFKKFVKSLSPLVEFTHSFADIISWKDPVRTVGISLIGTLIYLYSRGLIVVGALFIFAFGHIILSSLLKINVKKEKSTKMAIYKRNMVWIQEVMRLNYTVEKFGRKLFSEDKSHIIQLMIIVRKLSVLVALYFIICDLRYGPVYGYWLFLMSRTPQGSRIAKIGYAYFDLGITTLASEINQRVADNIEKVTQYANTLTTSSEGKASPKFGGGLIDNRLQNETKTFITYENNRWWIGAGFRGATGPGERSEWSDWTGRNETPKECFQLPSPDSAWRWTGDWEIVKGPKTDEDGWEYAADFTKQFRASKGTLDLVRRRKWARTCIKRNPPTIFK